MPAGCTVQPKIVIAGASGFAAAAAWRAAEAIEEALAERGRCSVALSGGTTPRPAYEALAREPFRSRIPWSRLEVYFADERCVPPEDPESNFRMARETLLGRVPLDPGRIHRIEGEREDRDAAAADYAALLPEHLDVLILGMGEDGHTASLFPGSPALEERSRRAVAAMGPKPPPWRITIAPPAIERARKVLVLVSGAAKAATLRRALALEVAPDPAEVPARLALRGTWVLDPAAAGLGSGR